MLVHTYTCNKWNLHLNKNHILRFSKNPFDLFEGSLLGTHNETVHCKIFLDQVNLYTIYQNTTPSHSEFIFFF